MYGSLWMMAALVLIGGCATVPAVPPTFESAPGPSSHTFSDGRPSYAVTTEPTGAEPRVTVEAPGPIGRAIEPELVLPGLRAAHDLRAPCALVQHLELRVASERRPPPAHVLSLAGPHPACPVIDPMPCAARSCASGQLSL